MHRSALMTSIIILGFGALSAFLQEGLLFFLVMCFMGSLFWQLLASPNVTSSASSRRLAEVRPKRVASIAILLPLGAATVFAVTIPVSLIRALFVEGGLTTFQGSVTSVISLLLLFGLVLWARSRSKAPVIWMTRLDLVPVVAAIIVVAVGVFSTYINRVTALAIFMAGGDHANHVGRAVSILNAGAAGSVERFAALRPGGLNPLHFLAAELFSLQGGSANFIDAADFYLFFSRFEWLQIGIWVLVSGVTAQVAFSMLRATKELSSTSWAWGITGAALLGILLLALPYVSSTGLLGFSTSVSVAWIALTPAVLLTVSGLKSKNALKYFFLAVVMVALVGISIRSSNAFQVLVFPTLVAIFYMMQRRRVRFSITTFIALLVIALVVGLFVRVLGPYVYVFLSAGNPSGTSKEPDFWLFSALLLIAGVGLSLRVRSTRANWLWAWAVASVFGVLISMVFLTLRFGSTPNDPDYLVSKTLFAGVAFIIPFAAAALIACVALAAGRISSRAVKVSVVAVPVAALLFIRPDSAWTQVLTAWAGEGHPMTWYSAAFSRGLPDQAYAFSLKNRDASWLAGLSFEAYSLPALTYDQVIAPNPEPGLCEFIDKNDVRVMVTDGFELQGALTDCPAAAGVSYIVPPRQAG